MGFNPVCLNVGLLEPQREPTRSGQKKLGAGARVFNLLTKTFILGMKFLDIDPYQAKPFHRGGGKVEGL